MKSRNEIRRVKREVEKDLLDKANVQAVSVGEKVTKGEKTGEMVIRVYVTKKKSKSSLAKKDLVPEEVDGVKTDVIEKTFELHAAALEARAPIDEIRPRLDTGRYDPLRGGIGIGPCRAINGFVYVGTLGCIVRDNATNDPMLLSNFHVMCVDDGWSVGDDMAQPSRVDGGSCPADTVGQLQRAALTSKVDAAVASHDARGFRCEIEEIGDVRGTNTATVGMAVRKRGRTTELGFGTVVSTDLSVTLDYGDGLGTRTLTDQIEIEVDTSQSAQFGNSGDSGSVVVDDDEKVVGLYFAGTSDGSIGVANHIQDVLDELDVSICTAPFVKDKFEKNEFKEFLKFEKNERKEFKFEKIEKPEKELYEHKHLFEKDYLKERVLEKLDPYEGKARYEGKDMVEGKQFENKLTDGGFPGGGFPGGGGLRGGGLEERLHRLEALAAQFGGAPASSEGAQLHRRTCIDLRLRPGAGPNTRTVDGASFLVRDFRGTPTPQTRVDTFGAHTGLNAGFSSEVRLPRPCGTVEVTLVHFSQPATVEAFNDDGSSAGMATMSGPQNVAETLSLSGTSVRRLVIRSPQNEVLLLEVCCLPAKPKEKLEKEFGKPEFKDFGKHEIKEKPEKLEKNEIKELIKEKHEIKEKPEFKEHGKDKLEKFEKPEKEKPEKEKPEKEKVEIKEGAKHEGKEGFKPEKESLKPEKEFHKGEGKPEKEGKSEFEKAIDKPLENIDPPPGGGFPGGNVPGGNVPGGDFPGGGLEGRLARLEAALAQMSHFIGQDLRPDLSQGALSRERDVRR